MQIVSIEDNLHETLMPICGKNRKNTNLSSAEIVNSMLSVLSVNLSDQLKSIFSREVLKYLCTE